MKNYTIRLYELSDYNAWNAFITSAKNATFLFHRDFMEYHNDRFIDYSLMVYEQDTLVAVLPANKANDMVFSHQGLSYGGLVYNEKIRLEDVVLIFRSLLLFLDQHKIKRFQIKPIPLIYHQKPAQELEYVLFLTKAILIRRDALAVIDMSRSHKLSDIRKRGVKKGIANGLIIREEVAFEAFWDQILIPNLSSRHDAKPVHKLQEIELLQQNFPDNIRQFNVYFNDVIVAGTTIFETATTAHAQYISANETRAELGSLDYLFHHLIFEVFKEKVYFDFGISNENQGKILNTGLSYWKESFGASTIVQDFYEVETSAHSCLEAIFI